MNKATESQPATNAHGALLITTTVEHDGIAFRVSDGVQVVDELTKTFTDRGQAAAYYRHVAAAAQQGKRIHQIVWEVQALEEAQNAATGRTAEEIAEAINAEVDAHHAETVAVHNATVQAVAEVMAGAVQTGGWNGARKHAQRTAAATTDAMDRIITAAAHSSGWIARGGLDGQADTRQLGGMNKRGLITLAYRRRGNTRVVTGGWLTVKGYKHAGVEPRATADAA
jgi:hypothetical protein